MRAVSFAQQQEPQHGDRTAVPATAAKKRSRDIRGIERFRQVVYGDKGLPRFHAMVARNAVLMYPPEGMDEARRRVQKKHEEAARAACEQKQREKPDASRAPMGDDDIFALFEERRVAENTPAGDEDRAMACGSDRPLDAVEVNADSGQFFPLAGSVGSPSATNGELSDQQLANYHHRQLDALIGLYYEFNHLTFMKLPMKDTLQMLHRCGREAVAHTTEFELQLRMQREARLRELDTVVEEERELKRRQLEAEEKMMEMELEAAEEVQRALVHVDNDDTL